MKLDNKALLFEMADKARKRYYEENDVDAYEDPIVLADQEDQLDEIDTPEYGEPMLVNQEEDPVVIPNNTEFDEDEDPEYVPVEVAECDDMTEEEDSEYVPVEEDEEEDLYFEEDEEDPYVEEDEDPYVEEDEEDVYFEEEDEYGNPIEDYDEEDPEYQRAVAANNEVAVESKHFIKSVNKNLAKCRESYRVYKVNAIKKTNQGLVAECITKNLRTNRFKKSSVLVQGYNKFYEKKAPRRKLRRRVK